MCFPDKDLILVEVMIMIAVCSVRVGLKQRGPVTTQSIIP